MIRTEAEHARALERIEQLMDVEPGFPGYAELVDLVRQVEAYECEHHKLA